MAVSWTAGGSARTDDDLVAGSTYTYTGVACGTAADSRILVATVTMVPFFGGAFSATEVKIGGITATKVGEIQNSSSQALLSLWYAAVPTGTTTSVSVKASVNITGHCISLVALYDAMHDSNVTPVATASITVNVPTDGASIVAAYSRFSSTITWTNATVQVAADPNFSTKQSTAVRGTAGSSSVSASPAHNMIAANFAPAAPSFTESAALGNSPVSLALGETMVTGKIG